jgi:hypothetical protein
LPILIRYSTYCTGMVLTKELINPKTLQGHQCNSMKYQLIFLVKNFLIGA